jgi:hypothetical protein
MLRTTDITLNYLPFCVMQWPSKYPALVCLKAEETEVFGEYILAYKKDVPERDTSESLPQAGNEAAVQNCQSWITEHLVPPDVTSCRF